MNVFVRTAFFIRYIEYFFFTEEIMHVFVCTIKFL